MGTWGGAERVVQPTDLVSGRFSCFPRGREDREEDERGSRKFSQGLLAKGFAMKARILRLTVTLMTIAATVLAGGASLKGF
jgi:hypothetical protein